MMNDKVLHQSSLINRTSPSPTSAVGKNLSGFSTFFCRKLLYGKSGASEKPM
jgi:hypothetical protein